MKHPERFTGRRARKWRASVTWRPLAKGTIDRYRRTDIKCPEYVHAIAKVPVTDDPFGRDHHLVAFIRGHVCLLDHPHPRGEDALDTMAGKPKRRCGCYRVLGAWRNADNKGVQHNFPKNWAQLRRSCRPPVKNIRDRINPDQPSSNWGRSGKPELVTITPGDEKTHPAPAIVHTSIHARFSSPGGLGEKLCERIRDEFVYVTGFKSLEPRSASVVVKDISEGSGETGSPRADIDLIGDHRRIVLRVCPYTLMSRATLLDRMSLDGYFILACSELAPKTEPTDAVFAKVLKYKTHGTFEERFFCLKPNERSKLVANPTSLDELGFAKTVILMRVGTKWSVRPLMRNDGKQSALGFPHSLLIDPRKWVGPGYKGPLSHVGVP